jgi:hypothetical protein
MLIICLILFAIGCAISASNKNRNVVGWFIVGILLGPFGLIYILLLNPKEEPTNAKNNEQPGETTQSVKSEGKWDGHPLNNRDQ